MAELKNIEIRGAREHNLKNIDIDIPRDQLVVITGLSGSRALRGAVPFITAIFPTITEANFATDS